MPALITTAGWERRPVHGSMVGSSSDENQPSLSQALLRIVSRCPHGNTCEVEVQGNWVTAAYLQIRVCFFRHSSAWNSRQAATEQLIVHRCAKHQHAEAQYLYPHIGLQQAAQHMSAFPNGKLDSIQPGKCIHHKYRLTTRSCKGIQAC